MTLIDLGFNPNELSYDPPVTPGRVLHIDGDFVAYFVAHDNSEPYENMVHSAQVQIETLKKAAGAETVCVHTTGKNSTKGGRYKYAIQKEYQGNRKNLVKPIHLEAIRNRLTSDFPGVIHLTQEADDGLCQANWKAVQAGTPELAVIVSKDKDLMQCMGWHMDWDTHELFEVSGFGSLEMTAKGNLIGTGEKFFWAQMIMGDVADNIQGLPYMQGELANMYLPTAASSKAECYAMHEPIYKRTQKYLERTKVKCGPSTAFAVLSDVNDPFTAFNRVYALYCDVHEFKNFRTGDTVSPTEAFISEAKLLWMRRTPSPEDWRNWVSTYGSAI